MSGLGIDRPCGFSRFKQRHEKLRAQDITMEGGATPWPVLGLKVNIIRCYYWKIVVPLSSLEKAVMSLGSDGESDGVGVASHARRGLRHAFLAQL